MVGSFVRCGVGQDFGWTEMLAFIDTHSAPLAGAEAIGDGYRRVREALGEGLFDGVHARPLAQFIGNAVPGNLNESAALGRQLIELRGECGGHAYEGLQRRLLSDDQGTVLSVLAELHVLRSLRERQVPVRLVEPSGRRRTADLMIDVDPPIDVEVSYLSVGSTWQLAEQLRTRLEILLAPFVREHHLFVQVRCNGFAGELLRHVPDAIERFSKRVREPRAWEAELAPGLGFHVEDCPAGWVYVSGMTIRSADPFGNESILVRLPGKMAEKAPQVRPGGIVFVRTSELSSAMTQMQGSGFGLLAELVRGLEDVGSRARNVSAFAVLDEMGTALLDAVPHAPAPAVLSQAVKSETRQRLLWVPNPHAEYEPKDHWQAWFELPF